MRNQILAIAATAAAFSAPIALRAQTVGAATGASVVVEGAPGLAVEQYPAFHQYVIASGFPITTFRTWSSSAPCCRRPA